MDTNCTRSNTHVEKRNIWGQGSKNLVTHITTNKLHNQRNVVEEQEK
jgi:hypothetical protein